MINLNKINRKSLKLHAAIALVLGISGTALAAVPTTSYTSDKTKLDSLNYNQNWDQTMRELFYYTPQGSRLFPYSWFLALEQANSEAKFADKANLARFGLISDPKSPANPDGLPIGFTKDRAPDGKPRSLADKYPVDDSVTGPWLGLNCAACHTNDVTYKGKTLRIDGGPSLSDFGTFFQALSDAVKATRPDIPTTGNNNKFNRFAKAVYGHEPTADELAKLNSTFQSVALSMEGQTLMRTPPLPAGAGRIDALGQIINALSVFDLQKPDNLRPPTAPVSYPFLWVAPHLDYVQWVPVAGNPITRNAGEVLGVFGGTTFTNPDPANRLHSSVLLKDLYELEDWLAKLNPPPWRADLFGAIDTAKADAGKKLFDADCRSCHSMPPFAATDLTDPAQNMKGLKFIKITGTNFMQIGTDTNYSLNLLSRLSETGTLQPLPIFPKPPASPIDYNNQPIVPAAVLFLSSVGGVVGQALVDQAVSPDDQCKYSGYRFPAATPGKPVDCSLANSTPGSASPGPTTIKAGPLLGIWATGPFLHNGSVPNVFELLSPVTERSKKFWVGNHELDTVKLGFVSDKQAPGLFEFDTSLSGNKNTGHPYPAKPYTKNEKMALIEYLKQDSTNWRPNKED